MAITVNSGGKKIIRALFFPANALMSRLGVAWKFALLGLMSLVAIAVVVYSLFASLNQAISFSQRELKGIALIGPISRTVQAMQQHRGLSSGFLGGNEAMREWRTGKEKETTVALRALEEKLPSSLATGEDFRRIRAGWERIRKEGLNWMAEENFAAHTRLIELIRLFEMVAADEYALTLDPEINTYYLIDTAINKLPHTLEYLAQIRGYGTGLLARKQATGQQKIEMTTMIAELGVALEDLNINRNSSAPTV